jgi:hypothetical protein
MGAAAVAAWHFGAEFHRVMIAEKPKDKAPMGMPPGGMGGMDF